MPGRGPQTFKKRQKEQERKERRQEKLAKRLAKKTNRETEPGSDENAPAEAEPSESLDSNPEPLPRL